MSYLSAFTTIGLFCHFDQNTLVRIHNMARQEHKNKRMLKVLVIFFFIFSIVDNCSTYLVLNNNPYGVEGNTIPRAIIQQLGKSNLQTYIMLILYQTLTVLPIILGAAIGVKKYKTLYIIICALFIAWSYIIVNNINNLILGWS